MENVFEHDAIPTWSGFIYQGRIAVYLAIKKIIELRDGNKISEIDKYAIEMEKCEDIAIVYKGENEKREYISIHQVKNEKEDALSEYKIPLIQLMLEKGYYQKYGGGVPAAYLHIANNARTKTKDFETGYLKNLKNWKQDILNYYNAIDKACKNFTNDQKFYEELQEAIKKDPIGIDRSEYTTQYNIVKKSCKEMMEKAEKLGKKLLLPVDAVTIKDFPNPIDAPVEVEVYDADKMPADREGCDIGPKTQALFADAVKTAKTVVWNGPMGVFENPTLAAGTIAVAKALADTDATTIIGGGDSAAAVNQLGFGDKMTHISTGGGASLEFLEGKELPGVAAANDK